MDAAQHLQQGEAAHRAGHLAEAETHYKAALEADIDNFASAALLGQLLMQRGNFAQAEIYLTHALHLNGGNAQIAYALGLTQMNLNRPGDALISYERALKLKPDFVEALNNRGLILIETILEQEALHCFDRALTIKPDSVQARSNRETLFAGKGENTPKFTALAYFNLGVALQETKRLTAALAAYEAGLKIDPNLPYLRSARLDAKMQVCDWRDYDKDCADIAARIGKGEPIAWPFQILATVPDPALQLTCARIFVSDKHPAVPLPNVSYDHARLRIAYMSSDFRNHPVAHLIAGILEQHDHGKFETFGISLGPDDGSVMRKRLENAFDRFLDGRQMDDAHIAAGIRDLEIDILVDLNGHTSGAHTGVLAHRAAPVQVNFLGYPATMGADYIDYVIADRVVIPAQNESYFSEKIAAMPICFQPNTPRTMSDRIPSRTEYGLPEKGFVFCAFNSSFKITPDVFAIWMRLLEKLPGSVLWLRDTGADMRANLSREAKARGISATRLIFAPTVKQMEDHLARHRQADLFLDTLDYNAHTTASDALWSGLPVLTCPGGTYASRVSASLLQALDLPELIAKSPDEYEALALDLAHHPARLAAIKTKLAMARTTSPLFDSVRFARDLESAYRTMWEKRQKDEMPESFDVRP